MDAWGEISQNLEEKNYANQLSSKGFKCHSMLTSIMILATVTLYNLINVKHCTNYSSQNLLVERCFGFEFNPE
jgi:hypothetical protein